MRTTAQQFKSNDLAPHSAGPVQTKRRLSPVSGPGNRHRANHLERQADDIAERILRGENDLGKRITGTKPASRQTAETYGSMLPVTFRGELEEALGADLSAVRIHTGTAPDVATKEEDAEAFTSGRDIYFRSGKYSPYSAEGRHLIAHEVVHVLQQTGRRRSSGVLAATASYGVGEIQNKRTSPLTSSTTIPTFEEMAERHQNANPKDTTLTAKIKQIKSERDAAIKASRLETYWDELQQYVRSNPLEYNVNSPGTQTVRSFIYDVLKLASRWDGAVFLLGQDVSISTTFFSADAYANFPEGAVPGMTNFDYNDNLLYIWETHPFFEKFRFKRYVESIGEYLVGPTRSIPDLEAKNGEFDKLTTDKLAERNEPTGLIENELFFVTIDVVRALDQVRVKKLAGIVGTLAKGKRAHELTPNERSLVASAFAKWANTLATDTSRSVEVNAILKTISPALIAEAEGAERFWSEAANLLGLAEKDIQLKNYGDIRAGLKKFAQRDAVKKLGEAVLEQAKKLFALDVTGNPIAPDAYKLARDEFITKISEKLYDRFEKPMLAALRSGKSERLLEALLHGWLFLQIYELIDLLQKYDPDADKKLVEEYAKISPDYVGGDVRVRHRLEVASRLYMLGSALNWTELDPVLAAVFTPAAGEKTLLAIFDDFQKDSSGDLDVLTKDLSASGVLVGGEPLTVGDIRTFFYLQRYKTISSELTTSLEKEKNKPGSESYGLVKRAFDAANKLPEPTRYTNKNFYAAVRIADVDIFSPLVRVHPKFLALRQKLTVNGIPPVLLMPTGYQGELVVWSLPPPEKLAELIQRYQGIKEFNLLIYEYESFQAGKAVPENPDLSGIATRPWNDWLSQFLTAVRFTYPWFDQNLDPEVRDELMNQEESFLSAASDARSKLSGEVDVEYAKMIELLRRASIIDREKKATEIKRLLGDYERYDQFSKGDETHILRYLIPDAVLDEITYAIDLTMPKEDQPLHQTALLLELADLMAEKFQDSPRFDLMVAYLPLMEQATDIARTTPEKLKTVLTGSEKEDDWISKRVEKLEGLSRLYHALQQAKQLEFGLQGIVTGSDKYLVGVGEGYVIKPGENFTINGIQYTVVDVLNTFTYYPKHGTEPPKLLGADEKPLKLSTPLIELRYGDSDKNVTLRGSDNDELTDLSNAVTLEGIKRQLDDLAAFIKGAAELTLDLVELIPGPGQAIMAARLAISVLQFLASDEFEVFVDFVTNHPVEALEQFGKVIAELATPSLLWEYLFFGNNAFDQLHATKEPPAKAKVPRTITEKLTKVILRLYNFGKGVLGSLGRLQTHTRWRAESLEIFVLSRPTLAWVVRKLADYIDYIVELVGEAIEFGNDIDRYRAEAKAALTEWPQKVIDTVDALRKFQLPDEIIPVADLVEIVVSMVLQRLPTKFRIASNVIMFLLKKFGKDQALFDAIAAGVKEIGMDPNEVWRSVREEHIRKPFETARNELAYTIFNLFGQIPTTFPGISPDQFTLLTPEQQKLFQDKAKEAQAATGYEAETVSVEEWEAYAPSGIQSGAQAFGRIESKGSPLPRDLRLPAEMGFRQNLGHVRLHTGPDAARFTDSVGAKALAGGSHIFLGEGVSPSTSSGRWILNHELAHVAHQDTSRLADRTTHSEPSPIPRGRGIVHDSAAESFASRSADALSARQQPPSTPSPTSDGIHPFGIVDITRRLLDDLAGTADIERDEKKEEQTGGTTGLKKIPANIKKQIDQLWETFTASLSDSTKTTFVAPFNSSEVKEAIISLLTSKTDEEHVAKAIEEALGDLAIDAVREKKEKPDKKGDPPKIVYELDVDRLEIALSRFVFGKSGILIDFDLESGIYQGAVSKNKDQPPSFKSIKIVYVHLSEIHGNHRLWQLAIATVLAGKEHDKYLPRLRAYIESKGPIIGIWDKSSYQLSKQTIDEVQAIMDAVGATLEKSKLPEPTKYISAKKPAGDIDNIGLRLGTYADPDQSATERESHHITQYLLLEYFSNKADKKPFPLLKKGIRSYPGLAASGAGDDAVADQMAAVGKPRPISLKEFEGKRGGKMPTILISAPTHRSGRLHVTTKADDWAPKGDKEKAPDSPAGVVHLKFREYLRSHDSGFLNAQEKSEGTNKNESQETFAAYVARTELKGKGHAQKVVYDSMQETYHWMRDFMQPRLKTALETAEMKYYNELGRDKGWSLSSAELSLVFAEAVAKNRTEMEVGGWY